MALQILIVYLGQYESCQHYGPVHTYYRKPHIIMRIRLLTVLFAAVSLTVLCSCVKEDAFEKPAVHVNNADWTSVPESGRTVELNDIVLVFPAGAFENGGKVAVTPVPKGTVKSFKKYQISEFYQVVIPSSGTAKPFTIQFHYSGDAKDVLIIEESPKWYRNAHKMDMCAAPLETEVSGGVASAVFPAICGTEGSDQYFLVGLIENIAAKSSPSTKAGDGTGTSEPATSSKLRYTITWDIDNDAHKSTIVDLVESTIADLERAYNAIGLEMSSSTVPYIITADFKENKEYKKNPDNPTTWGEHRSSKLSTKRSAVYLNIFRFYPLAETKVPDEGLYNQLKQTMIHETFHWIHEAIYDHRTAQQITAGGFAGTRVSGEWQMLSEAIATWIEHYTGDKKISEACSQHVDETIACFFNDEGKADYQNVGYGMGYFIDWLAKKTSDKDIVKLLEYQRNNGSWWWSDPTLRADFDSFLSEKKLEFFKPSDNWGKFMFELISGKIDSRVNRALIAKTVHIEKEKQTINYSGAEVIDDANIYNFSMAIQTLNFKPNSSMLNKMTENPSLALAVTQNEEKVRTWVCDMEFNKLGYAVKGKPFAVPGDKATKKIELVTERMEQDTEPVVLKSDITAQIVPWPRFIEFEYGDYNGYYSWSGDEIKVSWTSNGYYVEADFPGGSHLHFYIGWVNNRFKDVSNLYFNVEYDSSAKFELGRLTLDYKSPSSIEKNLKWKGTYKGKEVYLSCDLI